MILINFLPHREIARQRARQAFNVSVGLAVALGALIGGAVHLWYQGALSDQQRRNAFLMSEVSKLDVEIKEIANLQQEIAALKARQEAVENLQAGRNLPVHLLNEAVRQLPDGVYLKSLRQQDQNVLIEGLAQSNERVSELLRNLSRSGEWVTNPELIEIVATTTTLGRRDQRRVFDFKVRVQLRNALGSSSAASAARGAVGKGI